MKRLFILISLVSQAITAPAQRTVQLQNLWAEPQVHVSFQGYIISFTIRDINRALELLAETGDSTYGVRSRLDTAKQYYIELYPGYNTEYHTALQPLIQKGVGLFLLTIGHAEVENHRHRSLSAINIDIEKRFEGGRAADVRVYDPRSGKLLFSGELPLDLYGKDMGIDYY